jgi:hypothetical protein
MGATEFEDYGFGNDVEVAFNSCVREAHYEYGHDSYNGSISTVRGYQVFNVPTRANVEKVAALVWLLRDTPDSHVRYSTDRFKVLTGRIDASGTWRTKWKTYILNKGLDVPLLLAMSASIQKWESCCAIRVTGSAARHKREQFGWKGLHGDVYYFFGLAAC